ncbi:MAG: helix-turn-helix transcriptional regulator [Myxococcota bacterium]
MASGEATGGDRELLRERVRARLDETGRTQRQIETDCGWSSGTLTRVFGGRKTIDTEFLTALAGAVGVDVPTLVSGTTYADWFATTIPDPIPSRPIADAPVTAAVTSPAEPQRATAPAASGTGTGAAATTAPSAPAAEPKRARDVPLEEVPTLITGPTMMRPAEPAEPAEPAGLATGASAAKVRPSEVITAVEPAVAVAAPVAAPEPVAATEAHAPDALSEEVVPPGWGDNGASDAAHADPGDAEGEPDPGRIRRWLRTITRRVFGG